MTESLWAVAEGESPLLAAAIHDGHEVREEVAERLALSEEERRREEDPYTADWTSIVPNRVVARRSRFEVDLNRPKEKAVYIRPEDAWGLRVWKEEPPAGLIERSLAEYDAFYREVRRLITGLQERFGRFVVFDLHTYNHRRAGPNGLPADADRNPEVNLGTGTMERELWAPLVGRFLSDLRAFDFMGRRLDVRENVKFRGGNLSRWTHETFPRSGCCLAIEFKKFFMDEWSGELDLAQHETIRRALKATTAGVLEELSRLGGGT